MSSLSFGNNGLTVTTFPLACELYTHHMHSNCFGHICPHITFCCFTNNLWKTNPLSHSNEGKFVHVVYKTTDNLISIFVLHTHRCSRWDRIWQMRWKRKRLPVWPWPPRGVRLQCRPPVWVPEDTLTHLSLHCTWLPPVFKTACQSIEVLGRNYLYSSPDHMTCGRLTPFSSLKKPFTSTPTYLTISALKASYLKSRLFSCLQSIHVYEKNVWW